MASNTMLPDEIRPLPASTCFSDEGVALYEKSFTEHYKGWAAVLQQNHERLARGQYSLHWLQTDGSPWGRRAKPSSRGLTYTDTYRLPTSGEIPRIATWKSFAPRGAIRDP
jgi:hypothetical protein